VAGRGKNSNRETVPDMLCRKPCFYGQLLTYNGM
jgi:hypothetical protein